MGARVITGVVGIALFVGVCLWGVTPFGIGATVLAATALWELHRAFRAKGIRPSIPLSVLGLAAPIWLSLPPMAGYRRMAGAGSLADPTPIDVRPDLLVAAVVAVLILALCWEVIGAARSGELCVGQNVGAGLLCGAYVALFGGLVWLRTHRGGVGDCGFVLLAAACVWADDSFAFFVGRAWGRRKLAPALSPAKSVEGFVGGLVAAAIVGAVGGKLLTDLPLIGLYVGLIAGVLGPAGDLFESALKRELGVKDLGAIMPGHGGVLDRFDSLLFVAPAVAILLSVCRFG